MTNLNEIANKVAGQINISKESEIPNIIQAAADENGVDYNSLYRAAGNAHYEKYERCSTKVSPEAASGSNKR